MIGFTHLKSKIRVEVERLHPINDLPSSALPKPWVCLG